MKQLLKLSWKRARTKGDASPMPQAMIKNARTQEIKNAIQGSVEETRGIVTIEGTHASAIGDGIPVKESIEKTLGNVDDLEIGATLRKSANTVVVIGAVIQLKVARITINVGEAIVAKTTENRGSLLNSSLEKSTAEKLLKF